MKAWLLRTVRNSDLEAINHELSAPRFVLVIGSIAVIGLIWLNW